MPENLLELGDAVILSTQRNVRHLAISLAGQEPGLFAATYEAAATKGIPNGDGTSRDSICLSVSNSCTVGCEYCATFKRGQELRISPQRPTAGLLVAQYDKALRAVQAVEPGFGRDDLSAAFMGKGEPLFYAQEVAKAITQMHAAGLITRSTVSTSLGSRAIENFARVMAPRIQAGTPPPYFQVSLHSPNMEQRRAMVGVIARQAQPEEPIAIVANAAEAIGPLQRGTPADIRIRHTLMRWGEGTDATNFRPDEVRGFAGQLAELNSQLIAGGDKPVRVSVSLYNPTSLTPDYLQTDLTDQATVLAMYNGVGIPATPFARGAIVQAEQQDGVCGTMSLQRGL